MKSLYWLLALCLLQAGCALKSSGSCTTDDECGSGGVCEEGLCVQGGQIESRPLAVFTHSTPVHLGETITLDATASRSIAGTAEGLSFRWQVKSPEGVSLLNADGPTPSFIVEAARATYLVSLVVSEGEVESLPVEESIVVENRAPGLQLIASPSEGWQPGSKISLSALASDPDEDPLSYVWSLEKTPSDAQGELVGEGAQVMLQAGHGQASYRVKLTVSDGLASVDAELSGTLAEGPPFVGVSVSGTELSEHACVGVVCSAEGEFSATLENPEGLGTSFEWRVMSKAHDEATVEFTSPDALTTGVRISTPSNKPISGSYVIAGVARDELGRETSAEATFVVNNRPPVVVFSGAPTLQVPHGYDASTQRYRASGSLSVTVSDPDGDAIDVGGFESFVSGSGVSATVTPQSSPGTANFTLEVSGANASQLIGPGAKHLIVYTARDLNGALGSSTLSVEVTNREPVIQSFVDLSSNGHRYGNPSGFGNGYYEQYPTSISITDPDGDPLVVEWLGARTDGTALTVNVAHGGSPASPGTITVHSPSSTIVGLSTLALTVNAKDAWSTSTQTRKVSMKNRSPVITGLTALSSSGHSYGTTSTISGTGNGYWHRFNTTPTISDPDGDPLTATWSTVLTGAASARLGIVGSNTAPTAFDFHSTSASILGANTFQLKADVSDGMNTASQAVYVSMGNNAPKMQAPGVTLSEGHSYGYFEAAKETGYFQAFEWTASEDPDGDPLSDSYAVLESVSGQAQAFAEPSNRNKFYIFSTEASDVTPHGSDAQPIIVRRTSSDGKLSASLDAKFGMRNRLAKVISFAYAKGVNEFYREDFLFLRSSCGGVPMGVSVFKPNYAFTINPIIEVSDPDGDPGRLEIANRLRDVSLFSMKEGVFQKEERYVVLCPGEEVDQTCTETFDGAKAEFFHGQEGSAKDFSDRCQDATVRTTEKILSVDVYWDDFIEEPNSTTFSMEINP